MTVKITIFTPTYNRAYIINNLYESLKKQTYHDFEWLVVDDGSTDNTDKLFEEILSEDNVFKIIYHKQQNGGKHRAINTGLKLAKGELFFIVDSDDYLTENALEQIVAVEQTICGKEKFAGVCGQKGYSKQNAIGKSYEGRFLDITSLERTQYGVYGDKAEVFYTEILRKYPFPEFEGEKFLTECVVWDKIAFHGYKLRFFNEIIYICDYLPDGLTAHMEELHRKNPKGSGLYLAQSAKFGKIKGVNKWNKYLGYYYEYRDKMIFGEIARNLQTNPIVLYVRLFGIRLFYKLYDK